MTTRPDTADTLVALSCGCTIRFAPDSPAVTNGWIRLGTATFPCGKHPGPCIAERILAPEPIKEAVR